jgi:hypothetical protein
MVMRLGDDFAPPRRPPGPPDALGVALRPSQLRVAAALSRRPFGVRSARSVARLAGVSPSTGRRALHALCRAGIVERRVDEVAAGDVRCVEVWTIDWCSPAWHEVAGDVGRVSLPTLEPVCARPSRRVPTRLSHLFWNADLGRVDLAAHGHYLASRILRGDDCQALGWLAAQLHPDAIRSASRGRGLDPRRARLGQLLAGA